MEQSSKRWHRITEWWRPKAGTIFSLLLFYLALWDVPFSEGWKLLLFSFITLSGFGFTGYFLNDWADIPFDKKAGKTNLVAGIPSLARPVILLMLLATTLGPWFIYFNVDKWSIGLIGTQLLLQFAYPIPPIRLKNYPVPAIITDALYAFAIPATLAWHTFDITANLNENPDQFFRFLFLFLWMLALGIRQIINHHVADRHNDLKTQTPNITTSVKPLKLRKFLQQVLFPIELISAVAFFLLFFDYALALPQLAVTFAVAFGVSHLVLSAPFFSVSFSKTRPDVFSTFYLGLVGLLFLTIAEIQYLIVLIIFIALFTNLFSHPLISLAAKQSLKMVQILVKTPFSLASLAFNWTLYYFRKWLLRWPEERNWGKHYAKRLEQRRLDKKGNIAIFNQNHNKYTETFVRGHVEKLPFHVLFMHGWPAPIFANDMENIIASSEFVYKLRYHIAHFLNIDTRKMEDRYIVARLIEEKTELILAEFGTMGARLVLVAEQTGIPIIPIFYGYDAWHSKTISENQDAYNALFKTAPLVIGVSKDICGQLAKLGCAEDKVEYLPCFVDLEEFQFVQRNFSEPNFLAIGRLCSTKAPFLTILAFSKVLQKMPNASLTIMGGDEDGMLETCLSLVRSLNLETHVLFPGKQTPDEIGNHMAKASVFVQHSVTTPQTGDKEGTPVAIMEAMATGLPVISTNHAGIAEIVENGVTGILVNEFDVDTMATEMIALMNDKERMKAMGKAASEAISSNELLTNHIDVLSSKIEKHIAR